MLFAKELAKRYPNIKSVSVHPGRVQTNLLNHFFENLTFTSVFQKTYDFFDSVSVEKGVYNQLWAAVADKDKMKNGEYYAPVGKGGGQSAAGKDMALAEKLWEWQEAEFAKKGIKVEAGLEFRSGHWAFPFNSFGVSAWVGDVQ